MPCRSPNWHRHLGPATLGAALFMTAVAFWKLLFATDGPTRLEKDLTAAVELVDSVKGPAVDALFRAFDANGDGWIDYKEVAYALKKLDPEMTLEQARRQALDVFLLVDGLDKREMDRDEFVKYLQRFCLLSNAPFAEWAGDMLARLKRHDSLLAPSPEELQRQLQAVGLFQVADVYQDRKLDSIFSLFDRNLDHRISFQELCAGLYRFSGVDSLKDKAAAAAQAILEPGIESDLGKSMTREQFGDFMRRFAAASGVSFNAMTDYLLVAQATAYDLDLNDPGVKQLTKLIRKRLEERRRERRAAKQQAPGKQ